MAARGVPKAFYKGGISMQEVGGGYGSLESEVSQPGRPPLGGAGGYKTPSLIVIERHAVASRANRTPSLLSTSVGFIGQSEG